MHFARACPCSVRNVLHYFSYSSIHKGPRHVLPVEPCMGVGQGSKHFARSIQVAGFYSFRGMLSHLILLPHRVSPLHFCLDG